MPKETRIVAPAASARSVQTAKGQLLEVPPSWELLLPGDAALTRRVKASGPTWTVQEKKGRRTFSRGVWAPAERIAAIRADLKAERATPSYTKRRQADARRRAIKQTQYVEEFRGAVLTFLDFSSDYAEIAAQLAAAVATHATPVGSGTVARTERISLGQRAESAVIAWLRHQTTAYENMQIARVKGRRREVRRVLAEQSRRLLLAYRRGEVVDAQNCPLQQALQRESRP